MAETKKLLVICMLGRMGDLIAVEPVFRRLAEQNPDRRHIWVTTAAFAAIYRKAPFFDEIVIVKDAEEYLARKAEFPPDALVYEFNLKGGTTPGVSGAPASAACGQFPLLSGLTQNICPEIAGEAPRFYFDESVTLPELPEHYVVFHCVSNGRRRQWPEKRWRKLAENCLKAGLGVVEIGLHPVIDHPAVIRCTGKLDLQVAAAIVRQAELFVGIESGFAHLANAAHVPGLIIAGKLGKYPDYNPYTGFYAPDGNGCCMVRYFDVEPLFLPESPALGVLRSFLAGKPMSYAECQLYCREMQIREFQNSRRERFFRWLTSPVTRLRMTLLAHNNRHRK